MTMTKADLVETVAEAADDDRDHGTSVGSRTGSIGSLANLARSMHERSLGVCESCVVARKTLKVGGSGVTPR